MYHIDLCSAGSLHVEHVPVVLELLQGEDVLVEVLLKFLVGVVDVKLLEPIHLEAKTHFLVNRSAFSSARQLRAKQLLSSDLKVLEAEDVEDADGFEVFLPLDLLIDLEDDPGETLGIQRHGNRVSGIHGLHRREGNPRGSVTDERMSVSEIDRVGGRINVCVRVCADLLYSEWGADFLSSEDYGALSQDFRQLEGVQAQQLAGISDH